MPLADALNTNEGRYMLAYAIAAFVPIALMIFGLGLVVGGHLENKKWRIQ